MGCLALCAWIWEESEPDNESPASTTDICFIIQLFTICQNNELTNRKDYREKILC